ncbi:MAG: ATP-binding protein [Bacteroidota bacterium]
MDIPKVTSPFKFLDAYDKYDTDAFFGREKEIDQVYNKLYESNLLLVYGNTGTGKTSLVRCGLSGKLREIDWLPIFIRRGKNINAALEQALHAWSITPFSEEASLSEKVQSLFLDYYKRVYLIFDQFEELFLVDKSTSQEEATTFFQNVSSILEHGTDFKIILIIREEFLAHLTPYEDILQNLFENRMRVEYMRRTGIRNVIQKTIAFHDINLEQPEEEIVEMILQRLESKQTGVVELTYLQVYLDRLWRNVIKAHTGEDITFTKKLVSESRFENVMEAFLRDQIDSIEKEVQEKFPEVSSQDWRKILLSMLYVLVTEDKTKQLLSKEEIYVQLGTYLPESVSHNQEILEYCLDRLAEVRILKVQSLSEN